MFLGDSQTGTVDYQSTYISYLISNLRHSNSLITNATGPCNLHLPPGRLNYHHLNGELRGQQRNYLLALS